MSKCGTHDDHCCWFAGIECPYVTASKHPNFKYACSLREKYGSWEATHQSPEYLKDVKHKIKVEIHGDIDCGDWPPPGQTCHCGEKG